MEEADKQVRSVCTTDAWGPVPQSHVVQACAATCMSVRLPASAVLPPAADQVLVQGTRIEVAHRGLVRLKGVAQPVSGAQHGTVGRQAGRWPEAVHHMGLRVATP